MSLEIVLLLLRLRFYERLKIYCRNPAVSPHLNTSFLHNLPHNHVHINGSLVTSRDRSRSRSQARQSRLTPRIAYHSIRGGQVLRNPNSEDDHEVPRDPRGEYAAKRAILECVPPRLINLHDREENSGKNKPVMESERVYVD